MINTFSDIAKRILSTIFLVAAYVLTLLPYIIVLPNPQEHLASLGTTSALTIICVILLCWFPYIAQFSYSHFAARIYTPTSKIEPQEWVIKRLTFGTMLGVAIIYALNYIVFFAIV